MINCLLKLIAALRDVAYDSTGLLFSCSFFFRFSLFLNFYFAFLFISTILCCMNFFICCFNIAE